MGIEEVPYSFSKVIPQISRSHRQKNHQFDSNFQFLDDKSRFWTIIYRLLWNGAQGFNGYRRAALLFFKVIHPISRSHGPNKFTRPVAAINSFRFALLYLHMQACHVYLCNGCVIDGIKCVLWGNCAFPSWIGSLCLSNIIVHSTPWVCIMPGISPGMHPANERRRYIVMTSLIGWAHA